MKADSFRYDGKRALVVGGATGMGAATAELVQDLGAEVVVMDYADVDPARREEDPRQPGRQRDSIDAALDECGGPIHALFSCAGVADGTPGIEKVNFIGHRHLIDRALAKDLLPDGLGHRHDLVRRRARLGERTSTRSRSTSTRPTSTRAAEWIADHFGKADYMWSKQAVCAYVAREALAHAQAGHPHQRHPPGPDRHSARPGQRRHVARLRHRLPRRDRHRGLHARGAGRARSASCAATPPPTSTASR